MRVGAVLLPPLEKRTLLGYHSTPSIVGWL